MFKFMIKSRFYLFLFVLFQFIAFETLEYFENKNIQNYTKSQTNHFEIQHELIIEDFNLLSEVFYIEYEKTIADFLKKANELQNNQAELEKLRNEVFSIFKPIFENRKYFGVKTLHFHLKNRTSFLRLHNPKKFGDDLSTFRPVVNKVARDLKFVIEFEGGRMFNGYRYVYPLFINNEFVGSFEIGINLNAFKNKLSRLNQSVYEYFLEKSYIERFSNVKEKNNFQKTAISNKFCVNREFNKENLEHIEHVNQEIAQNKFYKDKFENKEKFAYWDNSRKYLVVFVPISNVLGEKIAYISRYTIDSFYLDNEANFFSYKAFIFILNSVFFESEK